MAGERLRNLGENACPEGGGGYGTDFTPRESRIAKVRAKLRMNENLDWKEVMEVLRELTENA